MVHGPLRCALPLPARYFPLERGLYEVAPGLRHLGAPFGNGAHDEHLFQFDHEFERYRKNVLDCRAEDLAKYVCTHQLAPEVARAFANFVVAKLVAEHPTWFTLEGETTAGRTLHCHLTQERLEFDPDWKYVGGGRTTPPYASAFDALCSQVQEDVAVVARGASGDDWVAALHLCSPSHWAAEDKIGKSFFEVHAPIPGAFRLNQAAGSLVDAMIRKGPYVRFVWGFGTDDRLNHHPSPPPGVDPEGWRGRSFDLTSPRPFILRVERQVTFGLPEVEAAVFIIRVSFVDGRDIRRDPTHRDCLLRALRGMTEASLRYKGLERDLGEVLAWLEAPDSGS